MSRILSTLLRGVVIICGGCIFGELGLMAFDAPAAWIDYTVKGLVIFGAIAAILYALLYYFYSDEFWG